MMKQTGKLAAALALAMTASVAVAAPQTEPTYSVSLTRGTSADTDIDNGGQLGRQSWQLGARGNWKLAPTWRLSANLGVDWLDWDWKMPQQYNQQAPFDSARRYHGNLMFSHQFGNGWSVMAAPTLQFAYANDASLADSKSYGVMAGAMRHYANGNYWGVGGAYFNDIGKARFLPLVLFNWQISDKWRLGNPLMPDFSGGAGIELAYSLTPALQWGIGSSKNTERVLAHDQQVVELSEWRLFSRVGWNITSATALNFYLGYSMSPDLKDGEHAAVDMDNYVSGALQLRYRF
ncbi:hypothetical protein J3L11_12030 [Shewanella sp. 4t3-1-2LB]|uniref:DUF6268 family outer membrane beta-barrel protein n=1 Tax=Shewanella sp. 4t3-1-2LB TaxID=2817682 RepID=UPI001A9825EF|nr:DUF6268 family outer membrane beta-barrel protein [Shewanella sp. 4t3-1-2LB]MBO1272371.1 hypothetical protein [Shewanella sp. 4t3-1-2LB]